VKYAALFLKLAALLNQFLNWLGRETAKQEERERIDKANKERLERQDKVADKSVTRDELDKSLRDGTF
jgi:hypothetical protein